MNWVEDRGELVIRRTWFGHHVWFLIFFALIWNGFLVGWYALAFGQAEAPLIMKLFPIGHVAVGLGLIYFIIATFLNRSDIRISPLAVEVRHGPMKWPGNKKVAVDAIKQLYVEEHVTNTKNGQSVSYRVNVLTQASRRIKLVTGLKDRAQALFIEKKIEEVLALPDEAVAGEL